MGDNARYGNPAEFEVDLHSIYAAYLYVASPDMPRATGADAQW